MSSLFITPNTNKAYNELLWNPDHAVDMDFDTQAHTSNKPNSWLKADLDGEHCIKYVLQYTAGSALFNLANHTCTENACSCNGNVCHQFYLTVDGATTGDDVPSGCKLGNTVKINGIGSSHVWAHELVIVPAGNEN